MKLRFFALVLGAATVGLAGCSSVDQVPLVYVSTVKVGVNVESGSAQTPGAKLLIGVDLTDAAYVPVAVSRYCSGDTVEMMRLCAEQLKDITVVQGTSKELTENDKTRIKQLADEANALSEKMVGTAGSYSAALSREAEAQSAVRAAEGANLEYQRLLAIRSTLAEGTEFAEAAQLDQAKRIADELDTRKGAVLAAGNAVESTRTTLNQDRDKLRGLTSEFLGLIPQQNGSSLGQSDAMSVFGTFTGDISGKGGEETGATVRLGKSFSTGIAAQHLARGFGDSEKISAEKRSECVKAVSDGFATLADDERKVETYQKLLARCDR